MRVAQPPLSHCQGRNRVAWLEREAGYLLPVEYHPLVFTLPGELAGLALAPPRRVYGLLFEAAGASVQELAADPKYLGAQVGLTAVLHTGGQTLSLHPHLHVLATGGGLSCNRQRRFSHCPDLPLRHPIYLAKSLRFTQYSPSRHIMT